MSRNVVFIVLKVKKFQNKRLTKNLLGVSPMTVVQEKVNERRNGGQAHEFITTNFFSDGG